MSISNGIITRPVLLTPSGGDIGQALGIAYDNVKDLVDNGDINPFAKYKPTRYATTLDTGESCDSGEAPNYWQAHDGMCGFTIPTNTNTSSGPGTSSGAWYKLLHSSMLWTYNKPTGGTYPYRQNDFDGYDHNAPQPITGPTVSSIMLTSDGKLKVQIGSNRGNSRSIQLSDLSINNSALSSWYVGVLVYYSNSQYTFKTGGRVSDGDFEVEFTNMTAYGGRTVQIVPFLSSGALSQGQSGNVTIVSCNVAPANVAIRVYSTGIRVDLSAIWYNSLYGRVDYTCNLINDTAAAITVYDIAIKLWRSDQQSPLNTRSIASDVIPAGGSDVITGHFMVDDVHSSTATYYITVESRNSVATGQAVVDEPRT